MPNATNERDPEITEDGDGRRYDAERRTIKPHARQMNREQRRDECGDPAAVDQWPRAAFFRLDAFAKLDQARVVAQTEVVDRRPAGVFLGVDRGGEHVPGSAEDSQRPRDGDGPECVFLLLQQDEERHRGVAHRRQDPGHERPTRRPFLPEPSNDVAHRVETEPAAEEQEERR